MFFRVQELEVRKIHFDVNIRPGEIDFSDAGVQQLNDLHAEGVAELLSNTLGEIRLRGHLQVIMQGPCDRCLEPVEIPLDRDFDLFYRPADTAPSGEEVALDEGEAELGFYDGAGLELEEALREQVLLLLPMHNVCREECQGICATCGQNRNQVNCDCQQKPADDRWSALQGLKTRLSESRN